ncbi:MAG: PAS domain-containing protein [Anaerolineae bacterium]|nr:PAS domain-containing protein [Anaerolineae bacterium]
MDTANSLFSAAQWQHVLFAQSLLGTVLLTPDHRVHMQNETWQRLMENATAIDAASPDTAPPNTPHLYDLIPQAEKILGPLLERAWQGESVHQETVRLKRNGRIVYWDCQIIPLLRDGRVSHLLLLIDDNTRHIETKQYLSQQFADRTEKLHALYDVIAAATEAPDARATLNWSLERILDAVQCPAGAIQIINDFDEDADVEAVRLVAHVGLSSPMIDRLAYVPVDDAMIAPILSRDEILVISDHLAELHQIPHEGAHVGVPMQVRERIVGILSVFCPRRAHIWRNRVGLA